jgi:hypothetical protein
MTPNQMLLRYLMASYAYYVLDQSLMFDHEFDSLCIALRDNWDRVTHKLKYLTDLDALQSQTGFHIDPRSYPESLKRTARRLLKEGLQ